MNNKSDVREPDVKDGYSKLNERKDKAVRMYKQRKITLKQRAEELTNAKIDYDMEISSETIGCRYYFVQEYPELFLLDDIYEQGVQDYLNLDLKIIIKKTDQNAMEYLLSSNDIFNYKLIEKDKWLFYTFSYSIEKSIVLEKIQENGENEKVYYLEILDPDSSYYSSLNIPRFNLLIDLIQLNNIFKDTNYLLVEPFNKLEYACYLMINNGCEIYDLRNSIREGRSNPHYYDDLKNVFRSTWEADIARVLNYKNIKWEFEKESVLLEWETQDKNNEKITRTHSYIPDFFLPNNIIIEVKGFWDYESVNKVHLFKKQIKDYELKIIDTDMMKTLCEIYELVIPELETAIAKVKKEKIPVVGIQIKDRKPFVQKLNVDDTVILERDKNNPYDKNAIRVLNVQGKMLGYVAQEWATIYAEKMDLGMKYDAVVKEKEPKVLYITVVRNNLEEEILHDFLN